jgi:very-short-patch-repair endonuclease
MTEHRYRTKGATLTRARKLRREMTEPEKRLWHRLRDNQLGGCHFRRQVPLGPYIADFCCLRPKLVIEIDGVTHTEMSEAEARRARWMRAAGYHVLRFWNNEVMENIEGVLEQIARASGVKVE